MKNQELRAYFFNNMYLTSIHAGIQAQHCTAEIFVKYNDEVCCTPTSYQKMSMLYDWADSHKTTIILNGGYASNLERLEVLLSSEENPYPHATFCESQEALRNCITSVGIILPEKIFNCPKEFYSGLPVPQELVDKFNGWDYSQFELTLAKEVAQCKLMT